MNSFEALTLIAANTIHELRKNDVFRVLESSQTVSDVDTLEYAAWIKENRADRQDICREVDECIAELGIA
jgi:hypothetical protein